MNDSLVTERAHERACVCVGVHVCVISSWAAGCRQPGRDKPGWMEGAMHVCVQRVSKLGVCVLVWGNHFTKDMEVHVPLSASEGLGGDKQTAKYSPCVFPAKTGGRIPTTQTMPQGQAWNELGFEGLRKQNYKISNPVLHVWSKEGSHLNKLIKILRYISPNCHTRTSKYIILFQLYIVYVLDGRMLEIY